MIVIARSSATRRGQVIKVLIPIVAFAWVTGAIVYVLSPTQNTGALLAAALATILVLAGQWIRPGEKKIVLDGDELRVWQGGACVWRATVDALDRIDVKTGSATKKWLALPEPSSIRLVNKNDDSYEFHNVDIDFSELDRLRSRIELTASH